jgi:hypothetical protein|tara:strand:- start:383 stop:586 length:204 start_codon:yes stop_codon:yes gene_type:complete
MKKEKEPFLVWASPAIFAIGIMGFLLYFEVDYLDIEMYVIGLWGFIGLWNIERLKKKNGQTSKSIFN